MNHQFPMEPWKKPSLHEENPLSKSKQPDSVTIYSLFPNIDKYALGYETVFKTLKNMADQKPPTFPPYNITKDGDDYEIVMAVAGYSREQLSISLMDGTLTVKTVGVDEPDDSKKILHKGIAQRNFTATFALAEFVEVKEATLVDGMLTIDLKMELPEEKRPKAIEIK
jgi:molecular chaperone IbpA